jgi:inosine-uridine nucleoside N-ribohydrolase
MHGVSLLLHTLESCEEDHCITIIALAPLTNLACALRHSPETVRKKVSRVVWMGGACCAGGNATSWAEANSFYDPEAAHAVLSSGE